MTLPRHLIEALEVASGCSWEQITGPRRGAKLVRTRQTAIYWVRSRLDNDDWTLERIGEAFSRDHTTVMHALTVTKERIERGDFSDEILPILSALDAAKGGPEFSASLPCPPSANVLWRHANGRMYKSPSYTAWLRTIGQTALTWKYERMSGPLAVTIEAERPRVGRDLDNIIKPILDALQSVGVMLNDSQCVDIHASWKMTGGEVVRGNSVSVRIEAAT